MRRERLKGRYRKGGERGGVREGNKEEIRLGQEVKVIKEVGKEERGKITGKWEVKEGKDELERRK